MGPTIKEIAKQAALAAESGKSAKKGKDKGGKEMVSIQCTDACSGTESGAIGMV